MMSRELLIPKLHFANQVGRQTVQVKNPSLEAQQSVVNSIQQLRHQNGSTCIETSYEQLNINPPSHPLLDDILGLIH